MIPSRPRPLRGLAALVAVAVGMGAFSPVATAAGVIAGARTVRAEGRAPVEGGRADTAYQRALDEAFRRGVLEALRGISPERQSPLDLEIWQTTILSRAADFVGAWRLLAQEQKDGFLSLQAEIEIWEDKLARAARTGGAIGNVPAVRVVVFASSLAAIDRAEDEQVDAGRVAAMALETEFARRGAVIVATSGRTPWEQPAGSSSEENRIALAAAAAKQLDADALIIAQLTRRGDSVTLTADLVATFSETTLATARAEAALKNGVPLAETFLTAARQIAASCAPHLAAARSRARRPAPPSP